MYTRLFTMVRNLSIRLCGGEDYLRADQGMRQSMASIMRLRLLLPMDRPSSRHAEAFIQALAAVVRDEAAAGRIEAAP